MREIKFRAFGKQDNQMHYFSLTDAQSEWISPDQEISDIMQATGLKDKNGKEIYEGDIVKGYAPYDGDDNEQIFEMKWDEAGGWVIHWSSGFNGGESDMTLFGWAKFEDYQFEVIGNIYEHPELLKQV